MFKSETGAQLLARLGERTPLHGLEERIFQNGPNDGDVFEFYGEEGVGKSKLLLHFVTKIILPKVFNGFEIGGYGAKVIYIDTDLKFQMLDLVKDLEKNLEIKLKGHNPENLQNLDIKKCVEESLKNLYIVRCCSSEHLICTLSGLADILNINPELKTIMIDSISEFYYTDKCTNVLDINIAHIIQILNKLISDFHLILFVTKAALVKRKTKGHNSTESHSSNSEEVNQYAEFLGHKWHSFVQKRFILTKETVKSQTRHGIYSKHLKVPIYFKFGTENVIEF